MDYFKTGKLPALIIAAFIIFHCHSAIGDELQEEPSAPGREVKSSITRSENSSSNDEQSETVPPEKGENIKSLGLPMVWKPYAGALFNWDRRGNDDYGGEALVGIYRDLMNPISGALGLAGEGYFRVVGGKADGGGRLMAASRIFMIQGGMDYSIRDNHVDWLVSFTPPLFKRGGLFGRGGSLRVDYYPGRHHSFNFGLTIPLFQPYRGKTRPKTDNAALPKAPAKIESDYIPSPELKTALVNMGSAMEWISIFTTPFFDQNVRVNEKNISEFQSKIVRLGDHINLKDALYPGGHNFEAEINMYHLQLERAFSLASGGTGGDGVVSDAGIGIADKAREIILDEVILPYDRLLGQRKTRDSLTGLSYHAGEVFKTWVNSNPEIAEHSRPAVMYIFYTVTEYIEEIRKSSRETWGDSRLVWMPLHYALRLEDHDTQAEIDAILEKAVEKRFLTGNEVNYVINEEFHLENARMINAAEDYHVLWIHDYRGKNAQGNPDEIAFRMTANVYLKALTDKVRQYDRTKEIPVYMIFIDQYFFESNDGRLWLTLLENPLEHEIDLPTGYEDWEEHMKKAQDELRAAVEQSPALQAGADAYGKKWLKDKVKIHINITSPADFSFRSASLLNGIPIAPDDIMRDHRKIAFHDITELDPGKGEAMYTGMGIGEHYSGPTWDDRALLVRGPMLVTLKDAAREFLLSQNFKPDEIPYPLKPLPFSENYDEMVLELQEKGWNASAMDVYDAIGYGPKPGSVVKAVLYETMPQGTHMYIPDSLWSNPFWGGMVVGSALRGCRVFVISPAFENAPSDGVPQMSRANEIFTRFVIIQNTLRGEFESAGGMFKTGIYNVQFGLGDLIANLKDFTIKVDDNQWFREVFPFPESVYEVISEMPEVLEARGYEPRYLILDEEERVPKLHFKKQFFVSQEIVSTLLPLHGWAQLMRDYILLVAEANGTGPENYIGVRKLEDALDDDTIGLGSSWLEGLSPGQKEKIISYLIIGAHNQNYRSMIMDGEVLVIVSGIDTGVAYIDFFWLMGLTDWVDDLEELRELLPEESKFGRWLGRLLKYAL